MMSARRASLWLVLLLSSVPAWSSPQPVPSDTRAEALADFDFMVGYLQRNYAGWDHKVESNPERKAEFNAMARRQRGIIAEEPAKAGAAMRDLLAWFKDRHTGLEFLGAEPGTQAAPAAATSTPAVVPQRVQTESIDVEHLRKRLARKDEKNPMQGLWESDDGKYRAAIVPKNKKTGQWRALILQSDVQGWGQGQRKFTIHDTGDEAKSAVYVMRDRSEKAMQATLLAGGDLIRFHSDDGVTFWWKRSGVNADALLDRHVPSDEFFLRALSTKTLWLRLPDFSVEGRQAIEKLLDDNASALASTPNLIIDLRGNSGGSDSSYRRIVELICTRPIYTPTVEFRATEDNARANERLIRDIPGLSDSDRASIADLANNLRAGGGGWYRLGKRDFLVQDCSVRRANPANVGILVTGAGSSGEQFVLAARESQKVTLFGGNTAGVIDYSNVRYVDLPSGKYRLEYATSRSMRLPDEPLDGAGIPPDVRLGEETPDQVGYVQHWLEARGDATPDSP